jgi:glycosyltransferase involved in cell wall biosynthesis
MSRLSVIVITKNEAENIVRCLRSVPFAHEWVVVDSGSTDGTPERARELGARVVSTADWPGFGPQKNRALDAATGDWVLSLDADEQVTPELAGHIREAMASGTHQAYSINRLSSYCGQYMHHSGWHPDRVVRLFRRGTARFSDDIVHERVIAQGPVGRLAGHLLHESMPSLESVIDKMDRYSTAGALAMQRKGVRSSVTKAVAKGLFAFLRTYVLKLGFLDGRLGFALAVSNAEGTYYRYLKLWLLQRSGAAAGQPAAAPPAARVIEGEP